MKSTTLEEQLEYYRSQHKTRGNKICHLIGIPLIALALPLGLLNWRQGAKLFSLGWAFQFIGHFVFEKNKPVLFSESSNPLTILAALVWVTDGWARVISGQPLVDDEDVITEEHPTLISMDGNGKVKRQSSQ
ncbi:MAG: DUF962 domain-containing protein [Terriglobales bacterium]